MKKKIIFSVGGALMVAALAVGSFSTEVSSFKELSAQATDACVPKSNSDCKSSATGNIYQGYEFATDQTEETVD